MYVLLYYICISIMYAMLYYDYDVCINTAHDVRRLILKQACARA
jgi:hypothetical protein